MVVRRGSGWGRRVRAISLGAIACCLLLPVSAGAARHYEKVSPADKGQGDIVGDGETTVAARLGDAVEFSSRTPFGDTVGSGVIGQTQYVARRTGQGWMTGAITPTPRPDASQVLFAPTGLQLFSDDLRTAVGRAYDLPAVTDDAPLRNNIYVEDTATRALQTVSISQVEPLSPFDFFAFPGTFWGMSADARHIAFVTPTQFLPDAVPGVPNVYKWDDGVLSVASVLPDGNVAANGADSPEKLRGAMSPDGSRLLFTASTGGNVQLYLHIDARRTVWVSQTELDPSDPNYQPDPSGVSALGMTPDGTNVFFVTDTRLLPEDTNDAPDLYRYTDSANPSSDSNLTLISHEGDLAAAQLIGMSDDGERVYYQTSSPRLVLWDHGTSTLITDIAYSADPQYGLGLTSVAPGYGRVTPDGNYFAFGTNATVDNVHGLTGEQTDGHWELYFYSLRGDSLTCVSCPSAPAVADATVVPTVTQGLGLTYAGLRPRFLADDGRVFFSTAEALVSQDTNGVLDTYEYDRTSDSLSLLSTGTGNDPSTFADASASGDDVFIVTRQRLVPSDHDDLVDLYDVRDGSSLPQEPVEQPRPPCQGDACRPPQSASTPEDPMGSRSFEDGGAGSTASRLFAVRQRAVFRGPSGLLRVRLFAAGRLAWSGRGLRSGSIRRSRAGTYEVRLVLGSHARARLRASGRYRTSLRLTFVSASGDEVTHTTRVTFRVAAKKGR